MLGLGKLGGQELNYSSDVDVIFLYSAEGSCSKVRRANPTSPGAAWPIINSLSNCRKPLLPN